MNARQAAFYRQAVSDWLLFQHLRPLQPNWVRAIQRVWCAVVGVRLVSFPVCHELHYLQMCTEKLSKAYYQTDPGTGHAAFRRLLAHLPQNPKVLAPLGFSTVASLTRWSASVKAIVDAIEDLAPAIADRKGLANPEYPWPKSAPAVAPVDHSFTAEIFNLLDAQALSPEPLFLCVIGKMVQTMQLSAWHL